MKSKTKPQVMVVVDGDGKLLSVFAPPEAQISVAGPTIPSAQIRHLVKDGGMIKHVVTKLRLWRNPK